MTPKDREHRIDTGSPEERVKAKWPDAYVSRCKVCGGCHVYRQADGWWIIGTGRNPQDAFADAASRLETK